MKPVNVLLLILISCLLTSCSSKIKNDSRDDIRDEESQYFEVGKMFFKYNNDKNTVELTAFGYGQIEYFKVPSTVKYESKTYTVNSIGSLFAQHSDITNLVLVCLPTSIKTIESKAFWGSPNLCALFPYEEDCLISDEMSPSEILSIIDLKDSLVLDEEYHVFARVDNSKLEDEEVSELEDEDVSELEDEEIGIPDSDEESIYLCEEGMFSIPESVVKIGSGAFAFCENMKSIKFPDNLEIIESEVCYGNSNLDEIYTNNARIISSRAFAESGCFYVSFEDNCKEIQDEAFMNCKNLDGLYFGSNVETIGKKAFQGCSNLKHVNLNEGLRKIYHSTFFGCNNLSTVNVPSTAKIEIDENKPSQTQYVGSDNVKDYYTRIDKLNLRDNGSQQNTTPTPKKNKIDSRFIGGWTYAQTEPMSSSLSQGGYGYIDYYMIMHFDIKSDNTAYFASYAMPIYRATGKRAGRNEVIREQSFIDIINNGDNSILLVPHDHCKAVDMWLINVRGRKMVVMPGGKNSTYSEAVFTKD